MTGTQPILTVANLETYYGPIMAIRGVSLEVPEGSVVTVLGANGAGKTTLLRTISGVMDPEKGEIRFDGQPIHGLSPDVIVRRGIVQVPEGREIFPLLTVAENLTMGAYVRTDHDGIRADMEMVYDYFPILRQRRQQPAGMLSGGQQQMLAIGRGLMSRPRLMLLGLKAERKVTMMLVEQNAQIALDLADYGYVMELGRIVMADEAEGLKASKDIQTFYLGMQQESERGQRRWKQRKTWR
jgi:branched-chain amino acid transport system ATP-binding protein